MGEILSVKQYLKAKIKGTPHKIGSPLQYNTFLDANYENYFNHLSNQAAKVLCHNTPF